MAKQTKQQRIDELERYIIEIYKKVRYGLMAQVKRNDRDPIKVSITTGKRVLELIEIALPNLENPSSTK